MIPIRLSKKSLRPAHLVYSFEGEKLDGDDAELPVLGKLIGKSADEVYDGVVELQRRDLVQARAQWRAVLPHAIANRLAKMALQNIPPAKVRSLLVDSASERLLRSFSRRVGYLDDSKEAKAIIETWLAPGGLLGDISDLNELGRAIFNNIAPVVSHAVLSALEHALAAADDATLLRCTHSCGSCARWPMNRPCSSALSPYWQGSRRSPSRVTGTTRPRASWKLSSTFTCRAHMLPSQCA